MKKSQTLSLDVLIAVMIFIAVIAIFYYISVTPSSKEKKETLKVDALRIASQIDYQGDISLIDKYRNLDVNKVNELYSKDKEQLKNELGLRNKFCIYIVDKDGNILAFQNKTGIGYGDVVINGIPCGEKVNP